VDAGEEGLEYEVEDIMGHLEILECEEAEFLIR